MLKDKFIIGVFLSALGAAIAASMLGSPTPLEKRFFLVALMGFGVPTLLIAAWNWKGMLGRAGYYGHAFEQPLSYPSSAASRVMGTVSAVGAALGVPVISAVCYYAGVPRDAVFHGLAGFLAGVLLPLGGSVLVVSSLTYFRWRGR